MIDLHAHSLFSDGTDTPEAMARAGDAAGLTALALTDHDTLAGLDRFMAQQPSVATLLVPGIELSCRFMGRPLHMLGLFLDFTDPRLVERVAGMRARRLERNQRMLRRLQEQGVAITWEDLAAEAPTDLISRMHFAKVLVRAGAAGSRQDAFQRFIGDDAPCHVPIPDLDPGTAVGWIHDAGGVAVVAHPGRGFPRGFRWDQAMLELKAAGIQGFEAYYPDYGPLEHRYFLDLARNLDLVPSGGSDYHGGHKPGVALGVGGGGLHVPDGILDRLLDARGSTITYNDRDC
jgi:predicted metal-dependent phosphoesterase TrpH